MNPPKNWAFASHCHIVLVLSQTDSPPTQLSVAVHVAALENTRKSTHGLGRGQICGFMRQTLEIRIPLWWGVRLVQALRFFCGDSTCADPGFFSEAPCFMRPSLQDTFQNVGHPSATKKGVQPKKVCNHTGHQGPLVLVSGL